MEKIKEGQKAPDFTGTDQHGKTVSLSDFKGKKIVLYFYPKDNTPGCTIEACNLRDNYSSLINAGYAIIGVSADSVSSHDKFAKKYNLPFSLISDKDKSILKAYGAWGPKLLYGKLFDGINRITIIINESGNIERIINKVKTGDHSAQILENK